MDDMNYGPLLIFVVILVVTIFLIIQRRLYSTQYIHEVFDKCNENEVKYRYFIRFFFDPSKNRAFLLKKNIITIRIHDKKGAYVTTFNIKTAILGGIKHLSRKTEQEIRLLVNRKENIPEWGHIAINTEEMGSIYVYKMRVKAIDTKEVFVVHINSNIKSIEPTKKYIEQLFKCEPEKWSEDNEDGRPEKKIEISELLCIVFLSLNMNLLVLSLLYNYTDRVVLCLMSAVLSLTIEIIVLLFYRLYFKYRIWRTYGDKWWQQISGVFLFVCFIFGFFAGVATVWFLIKKDTEVTLLLIYSSLLHLLFSFIFVVTSNALKCDFFSIKTKEVKTSSKKWSMVTTSSST